VEESDDDDDESSDEEMEMDMQDQNQLYEDEEDRKRLEKMPEFEREAILAERFEKRKAELDMKAALRDAKRREKEEKKALEKQTKKRKAPAAKKVTKKKKDEETSNDSEVAKTLAGRRTSTRDRNVNKKKESKATALAKLREERQKALEQKADDDESESDFGDDDDDSDDDYDELKPWQKAAKETASKRQKRSTAKSQLDQYEEEEEDDDDLDDVVAESGRRVSKQKEPKVEVPADLDDFLKVTLSRGRLGIWCSEPFFEEAVVGSYVKLFIGVDENSKKCYRLCRIVGVTTASKPYDLPNADRNAKPIRTDKKLTLRFQKSERDFYIKLVSDIKVDEIDVNQYITAMKAARLDDEILGKREAKRIRRNRDLLTTNYTYTKDDIEKGIKERKKKGETMANLGAEQTRLEIEVQAAHEKVENAKRMLLEASESQQREAEEALKDAERNLEMKLLEEEDLIEKVKSRKDRLKSQNKAQQWAKVNQRAIRTNRQADVGAFKEKEVDGALGADGKAVFNPYARRKVKPKILWEVGQKDEENKEGESAATTDAAKNKTENSTDDTTPSLVQEQQNKAAALSRSHQFTIDEEVMAQPSFTSGMAGLRRKEAPARVRKGLSLSEYQERKANGSL